MTNYKAKICILTSAHPAFNTRVFHKQARSIARAGYETVMVVPHEEACSVDGVRISPLPVNGGRASRMLLTVPRLIARAISEKADIYHFHDPELMPAGLLLKLLGKRVVYDVHEHYRTKILSKPWLPKAARVPIAFAVDAFESAASLAYDGVVTVDGHIAKKFCGRAVIVSNFPYAPEGFEKAAPVKRRDVEFRLVYVGGLSGERGLYKMVEAMGLVEGDIRLYLAGKHSPQALEKAKKIKGFERVVWLGTVPWKKSIELQHSADAGLLLLQPSPSYKNTGEGIAKLFEYMMCGLPVLASDFPNIKSILEKEGCGLTVDPADPAQIADRVMYLAKYPDIRRGMAAAGMRAVREKYNWEHESEKLLGLYEKILAG
jgi:glycosyltransferase involved in cell wall biosynthesis